MSGLPLAHNLIEVQRALTTSSTAIFIPFTTQELFQAGPGALYYGLTPRPLKSNVELLLMSLAPDAETNPGFSQHFEEEIAYVAQGEAVILFEDEEFVLSEGDTVRILPSRKHKFRNPGVIPLKVLFIKSKAAY